MSSPESREGGFIVLHRRLRSWPLWESLTALQQRVWIEMLLEANWKQTEVTVSEGRVVVHRGEFIATQETIADQAKVGRKVVRQLYAHLVAEGAIRQRVIGTGMGSRKGRRVVATTISNYSRYQDLDEDEGHRRATEGPDHNKGTRGTKKISRQNEKLQHRPPSDTRGEGDESGLRNVVKLNPDDCLTDWDHELQRHVPRGLTEAGKARLRRG